MYAWNQYPKAFHKMEFSRYRKPILLQSMPKCIFKRWKFKDPFKTLIGGEKLPCNQFQKPFLWDEYVESHLTIHLHETILETSKFEESCENSLILKNHIFEINVDNLFKWLKLNDLFGIYSGKKTLQTVSEEM